VDGSRSWGLRQPKIRKPFVDGIFDLSLLASDRLQGLANSSSLARSKGAKVSIYDVAAMLIGGWSLAHFTCRAGFMPAHKSPWYIKHAIALCAGAGSWLLFSAIFSSDYKNAALALAGSLALFEGLLWYDGQNVSEFYKGAKRDGL